MKPRSLPPAVLVPVVLVVAAVGWFAYSWYAEGVALVAARAKLLDHIEIELQKELVDATELGRLTARIQEFEDYPTAPDLLAAHARIELFRGRPERAEELFRPVANSPGAAPEHLSLAAEILLRRHEAGLPERGDAVLMLEQALAFADQAHEYRQDTDDLLHAWLAAWRLSDKARTDEFAARIEAEHQATAAHRLVGFWRGFSLTTDQNDLELVRAEFDVPPAELEVMRVLLTLKGGDVPGAVSQAETLLSRFAGLVEVRVAAFAVFHACMLASPEGSPERARWAVRRNAQLDWLFEQAAPEDTRRPIWVEKREQG